MKTHHVLATLVLVLLMLAATTASAQFSELYDFGNVQGDPLNPTYEGIIAQGRDGNLYSTTTHVSFGGVQATTFKVKSDTQVTATVPTGAKTGHIAITTLGGTATSKGIFTVTQ